MALSEPNSPDIPVTKTVTTKLVCIHMSLCM